MRLSKFTRVAGALALAAALVACNNATTTTTSSSNGGGAAGGTIKIGVDLPVSGADASIGIPTQNGVVLAVEEAGKNGFAGGNFKLDTSLLDDAVQGKHDPAAGAQNVKTFIADSSVLGDGRAVQLQRGQVGDSADERRGARPDLALEHQRRIDRSATTRRSCAPPIPTRTRTSASARATTGRARRSRSSRRSSASRKSSSSTTTRRTARGWPTCSKRRSRRRAARCSDTSTSPPTNKISRRCSPKSKSQNPDVVFFGGTTSTRRRVGARADGRRRHRATRRSSAATASATTSSSRSRATMANGTYYTVAAPEASKLPSAQSFVAAYKARFKSDVGPYSRQRLHGREDRDRRDRESDRRRRRQDADARRRAEVRRGHQRLRFADRQGRLRRERRYDRADADAAKIAGGKASLRRPNYAQIVVAS